MPGEVKPTRLAAVRDVSEAVKPDSPAAFQGPASLPSTPTLHHQNPEHRRRIWIHVFFTYFALSQLRVA